MKRTDHWLLFLQILKWLFLVDAAIFALISIGFAVNTAIFLNHSVRTTGTVTALEEHEDDEGSVSYSPTFTFTANGKAQTVRSNVSTNPPGFAPGETVPVRYRKSEPSDARVDTLWQIWGLEAISSIGSVVMSLVGLFFRWRVVKRKTRKPRLARIQSLNEI